MKIALIGLGLVAKFQIEALGQLQDIALSDAFDINEEAAKLLPANTRFHRSLDAMLQEAKADVFMVSTPNLTHFEIASRVIEAGKPVVVEKPICANMRELEVLVSEASRRSIFLHVALHASFAPDLRWWLDHRDEFSFGELVAFSAGFFDPLITDGQLAQSAASLGGSWFDSGINALSVIGKLLDPKQLLIEEARMTHVPQIPCNHVQGLAIVSFPSGPRRRRGLIDTNWTLGLNRKVTKLFYEGADIILDHTNEKVLVLRDGQILKEVNLSGNLPRLTNHYVALFRELQQCFEKKQGNIHNAVPLHQLMFSAAEDNTK